MKRLFALLITIIMVASLAACGTNNSNTNENNSTNPPASSTGDNQQSGNESGNGNTTQSGNNAEAAKLTGKMNIIELDDRDPSFAALSSKATMPAATTASTEKSPL